MKYKFLCPDLSDKRIKYAKKYLEKIGYESVTEVENADFVLLGVNPDKALLNFTLPIYAGNIFGDNIYDYTQNEDFAIKNAYLTAEGAIALAVSSSEKSLFDSSVLLVGYGRISRALHKLLSCYTNKITVCARSQNQLTLAQCNGADTINFEQLCKKNKYDFIINTVAHPVFNEQELLFVDKDTLIMDLASFPGGVDKHFAKSYNLNLMIARGLPAKFSPYNAGIVVAQTVDAMIKGGIA